MSAGDTGALTALGAREAAGRIRDGKISPVDLVDACLDRIHALDGRLSAWAYVDDDGARATPSALAAEAADGRIGGRLPGVPVAIKNIIHVPGMPTPAAASA